jgi:hypothetical protein
MEGVAAADGAAVDHGAGAVHWEVLWPEVRLLGYAILDMWLGHGRLTVTAGWAKWMEWNYPVQIVMSSPKTFKLAGAIEAAASL